MYTYFHQEIDVTEQIFEALSQPTIDVHAITPHKTTAPETADGRIGIDADVNDPSDLLVKDTEGNSMAFVEVVDATTGERVGIETLSTVDNVAGIYKLLAGTYNVHFFSFDEQGQYIDLGTHNNIVIQEGAGTPNPEVTLSLTKIYYEDVSATEENVFVEYYVNNIEGSEKNLEYSTNGVDYIDVPNDGNSTVENGTNVLNLGNLPKDEDFDLVIRVKEDNSIKIEYSFSTSEIIRPKSIYEPEIISTTENSADVVVNKRGDFVNDEFNYETTNLADSNVSDTGTADFETEFTTTNLESASFYEIKATKVDSEGKEYTNDKTFVTKTEEDVYIKPDMDIIFNVINGNINYQVDVVDFNDDLIDVDLQVKNKYTGETIQTLDINDDASSMGTIQIDYSSIEGINSIDDLAIVVDSTYLDENGEVQSYTKEELNNANSHLDGIITIDNSDSFRVYKEAAPKQTS